MTARTISTLPKDLDPETAWAAVAARDGTWDGRLVYGVSTTGIYCRPSCPSRRPRREHARFFSTTGAARAAGFRACHRCIPDGRTNAEAAVDAVRAVLDAHVAGGGERPTLGRLAAATGLSASHVQRLFKAQLGVSPAEYVRARRADRFRTELRRGGSVSRATFDAGYGSSRRAYADAAATLGMTPARYRQGGAGTTIRYSVLPSSSGTLLVAGTDRGLAAVSLGDSADALVDALRAEYPAARLERVASFEEGDPLGTWTRQVADSVDARGAAPSPPLDVQGTPFQERVWTALRAIPAGETRTYADVARAIGAPSAARAVAGACASNRVALVIPCHRVVRGSGDVSGYRWGVDRKRQLLGRERRQTT